MSNSISRKSALKRLGSLSLGMPFLPSLVNIFPPETQSQSERLFAPKKIKGKPNILWITTRRRSHACIKLLWKPDCANTKY